MNGLRATKTAQAVMIAPPVPATVQVWRREMPGNGRARQVQPTMQAAPGCR